MKERSAALSDQEVKGILAGELTCLWRPIRFPKGFDVDRFGPKGDVDEVFFWATDLKPAASAGLYARKKGPDGWLRFLGPCPFGVPGDQLRVKEASRWSAELDGDGDCEVEYRADGAKLRRTQVDESGYSSIRNYKFWTPSTQMPLWASRLCLKVLTIEARKDDGKWWWVVSFERGQA